MCNSGRKGDGAGSPLILGGTKQQGGFIPPSDTFCFGVLLCWFLQARCEHLLHFFRQILLLGQVLPPGAAQSLWGDKGVPRGAQVTRESPYQRGQQEGRLRQGSPGCCWVPAGGEQRPAGRSYCTAPWPSGGEGTHGRCGGTNRVAGAGPVPVPTAPP